MAKPSEFYLGVSDFFGILMPGAVFVFLHRDLLVRLIGVDIQTQTFLAIAAFLVAAYILGHFVLGIGVPLNWLAGIVRSKRAATYYESVKDLVPLVAGLPRTRANVFYTASAIIRVTNAAAASDIERQMADYKLFRSLAVVFAIDFAIVLRHFTGQPMRVALALLFCTLAAVRFAFLIHWTYETTFEYYAFLSRSNGPLAPPAA
jgi:hypothetical protein